jgi:hypothetical protein
MGTFHTITSEYNGQPNGPKFIVREHGKRYLAWFETEEAARDYVTGELDGRVVTGSPSFFS